MSTYRVAHITYKPKDYESSSEILNLKFQFKKHDSE